jgi:hypothetical protein
MVPFVVRIDMFADMQPAPRRNVAENSRVGAIVRFCLIRQSSVSPIVCCHQPDSLSDALRGQDLVGIAFGVTVFVALGVGDGERVAVAVGIVLAIRLVKSKVGAWVDGQPVDWTQRLSESSSRARGLLTAC